MKTSSVSNICVQETRFSLYFATQTTGGKQLHAEVGGRSQLTSLKSGT